MKHEMVFIVENDFNHVFTKFCTNWKLVLTTVSYNGYCQISVIPYRLTPLTLTLN